MHEDGDIKHEPIVDRANDNGSTVVINDNE